MPNADTKTFETRHGPMMALAGDRYITGSLEAYGELSPAEWAMLAQLVKPGMTVVEVGANIGAFSVPLARQCFPGPLYLFEPQQRVFQILCANLALNGIANAIAYPEACGETDGALIVPAIDYGASFNFGGASVYPEAAGVQGSKVRSRRLDDLDLAACHLLKVDVEGFESQVLRGAAATIGKFRPMLYVENDRETHQQELISLIAGMGYRLYWHTPPLFGPDNFKGNPQDIFGRIVSVNMLCLPNEDGREVRGAQMIDPTDWSSPIRSRS